MKILCIDVGIKNLSLCVMEKSIDKKEYIILLWSVYNIFEEDFYCKFYLKNGNICNKKAKFNKNNFFYCGIHYPDKKNKKQKEKDKIKKVCLKHITLQDLTIKVLNKLEEILLKNSTIFENILHINIELQPKINQKMKLISHIIFGKFVETFKESSCKIRFITGNKKLKLKLKKNYLEIKSNSYSNRKKICIFLTKCYLENDDIKNKEYWLDYFNNVNKKDDMADSFCYCIYTFENYK